MKLYHKRRDLKVTSFLKSFVYTTRAPIDAILIHSTHWSIVLMITIMGLVIRLGQVYILPSIRNSRKDSFIREFAELELYVSADEVSAVRGVFVMR